MSARGDEGAVERCPAAVIGGGDPGSNGGDWLLSDRVVAGTVPVQG